jgi:hypothetical protein
MCEIINDWSKEMSGSDDIESLTAKSLFLPLFRRCMYMNDLMSGAVKEHTSSKPSRMTNDRRAMYDMFTKLRVCSEDDHSLPLDGAWPVFTEVKLDVEKRKKLFDV